jgi:hypothetical protein
VRDNYLDRRRLDVFRELDILKHDGMKLGIVKLDVSKHEMSVLVVLPS